MDKNRQIAYRYLLYQAMLEIRPVKALGRPLRHFKTTRALQQIAKAGEIADAMRELALASCYDFHGFDEMAFWKSLEVHRKRIPEIRKYLDYFDWKCAILESQTPLQSKSDLDRVMTATRTLKKLFDGRRGPVPNPKELEALKTKVLQDYDRQIEALEIDATLKTSHRAEIEKTFEELFSIAVTSRPQFKQAR